MKAVIIFCADPFVLGVAGFSLQRTRCASDPRRTGHDGRPPEAATRPRAVDAIASVYSADIKALEASASPTDPVANLAIAEKYFEWADAVLQTRVPGGRQHAGGAGSGLPAVRAVLEGRVRELREVVPRSRAVTPRRRPTTRSPRSTAATPTSAVKIAEGLVVRDPSSPRSGSTSGIFYANAGNEREGQGRAREVPGARAERRRTSASAKDMLSTAAVAPAGQAFG